MWGVEAGGRVGETRRGEARCGWCGMGRGPGADAFWCMARSFSFGCSMVDDVCGSLDGTPTGALVWLLYGWDFGMGSITGGMRGRRSA